VLPVGPETRELILPAPFMLYAPSVPADKREGKAVKLPHGQIRDWCPETRAQHS
jgi:hypothetical protein